MSAEITSVWSSYGHTFMHEDGYESCLTCGATYALLPDAPDSSRGDYHAANGDAPDHCIGDTNMVHGYPGERHCHVHDEAVCEHIDHDCNCLLCV